MNLEFTPEENAFRDEVRDFLETRYPKEVAERQAAGLELRKEDYFAWQKVLLEKGWVTPNWPKEWGGTEWTPTQKYIWSEETAKVDALQLPAFGVSMVAPVLWTFGTQAQKDRFLTATRNGDIWWCQGYSEPGSGSDLASLKTRAVREGDFYIVNGQKTWTTLAQYADWGFFLVRTDPDAKKQEGISFLLIDMKSPGVTVRPIITMDGAHEVNEVFLDNVKVPVDQRVYEENKGWTVAKFLLSHERSGIAGIARSKRGVDRLRKIARAEFSDSGEKLIEDPQFRRKLADLEIDITALEYTELRSLASESAGKGPGPEASMLKIKGTEIQQRVTELVLEAVGHYGSPYFRGFGEAGNAYPIGPDYAHQAAPRYFNVRKTSIYGGSNEIQRNIIAKMVLGL